MTSDELCYLPAIDLAAAIRTKALSPVEVIDAVLGRIEKLNPLVNAYCTIVADAARVAARAAERAISAATGSGRCTACPSASRIWC